MAGLWSCEVIHTARLRPATLRAICPDRPGAFEAWWAGERPLSSGVSSSFVLLDPAPRAGQRPFVGLEEALAASLRPRFRGYADALAALAAAGLA
jgi:hypothetical protein